MFVENEHHILIIAQDADLRGQLSGYLHSQYEHPFRIYDVTSLEEFLALDSKVELDVAILAGGVFTENEFLNYRARQQTPFPVILIRDEMALRTNRALQKNTSFTQLIKKDDLSRAFFLTTVKYLVEFKSIVLEMKNLQGVVEVAEQRNHRLFQYISHELTAPLQMAKLLQENVAQLDDADEMKASLGTSIIAITHALDTISNLSEYVRSNRKMLHLEKEEFNVVTVLEEVQDLFELQACHKGIDLQIDYFSYEDCRVKSDKARIRQVLINLVRNALNYTDRGSVTVWAQRGEGNLCISVTDTGIGMSEDKLTEILTRKTYEPSSGIDGGLGIGLKLSREIIELIGGYLSAHSVEGKGTTFTMVLPDELEGAYYPENLMAQAG
jgi:signal transduction histidine kinase